MKFAVVSLIILAFGYCVSAQTKDSNNGWESKPVDQWTDADVKGILQNSAWSWRLEGRNVDSVPMGGMGTIRSELYATFSLESALTVRLAAIRKRQLSEKYDAMNAKDKAAFNTKYKSRMECPLCAKFYIVAIGGESRTLKNQVTIQRRVKSIYLSNEKGERRILANFSPQNTPGSSALFFFPRKNEKGEPLLTADNTTLTFNFPYEPDDEPLMRLIERVEIKVKDIVRDKTVIF